MAINCSFLLTADAAPDSISGDDHRNEPRVVSMQKNILILEIKYFMQYINKIVDKYDIFKPTLKIENVFSTVLYSFTE